MRITGGEFCGRRLKVPKGVRPTQDRVKEALFSSLGDRICGGRFLDVFAGSGAVGLDALSRGSVFVCWVEADKRVLKVLNENVELVCGAADEAGDGGHERMRIIRSDAMAFLDRESATGSYNVIFADPPYARDGSHTWIRKALKALGVSPMLEADGVLVVEQAAGDQICEHDDDDWTLIRNKVYGETRLLFFKKGKRYENR